MTSLFAKLGAKAAALAAKSATTAAKVGAKAGTMATKASAIGSKAATTATKIGAKVEKVASHLEKASALMDSIPMADPTIPSITESTDVGTVDAISASGTSGASVVIRVTPGVTSRFWFALVGALVLTVIAAFITWTIQTQDLSDKQKDAKRTSFILSSVIPMILVIVMGFGIYWYINH